MLHALQVKFDLFQCLHQLARLTPEQRSVHLISYFDKMNVNTFDGPMSRPTMWGKPFADMFLLLVSHYSGAMLQLCPDVFISGHLSATITQPGCNRTPLPP